MTKNPKFIAIGIWLGIAISALVNITISVHFSDAGLRLRDNQIKSKYLIEETNSLRQKLTTQASLHTLIEKAQAQGYSSNSDIAQISQDTNIAMSQ